MAPKWRIQSIYNGKRILAVVPARGGSKGVPLKNLRKVCGHSLVAWVGEVVQQIACLDRAVVSTDHEGIASEAEKSGIDAPFRRPAKLSGDRIGDVDVLQHAVAATEELDGIQYDVVVMLQPTSPSRRPEHIEEAIRRLLDGNYDAVWSVSETDLKVHPLKQLLIAENGQLRYYDPRGAEIVARQQLIPVYHRNGIVYAITRDCLLATEVLLPKKSAAIVVNGPVINIDTEEDIVKAEKYMNECHRFNKQQH
ncbi:MAG: acylneuraminate cytidylyltransferase family protein [Gammaproteobacteria bacterium]|nr:acylneuraminate cytidylyltransferase family protein [Gammaproteobacteria bacterium]